MRQCVCILAQLGSPVRAPAKLGLLRHRSASDVLCKSDGASGVARYADLVAPSPRRARRSDLGADFIGQILDYLDHVDQGVGELLGVDVRLKLLQIQRVFSDAGAVRISLGRGCRA
jgi:hypothetical protein